MIWRGLRIDTQRVYKPSLKDPGISGKALRMAIRSWEQEIVTHSILTSRKAHAQLSQTKVGRDAPISIVIM